MSANSLLLWMSARRRGSWSQFRAAVEELHLGECDEAEGESDDTPDQFALPLYQTLRFNLQRMGHAEFFAGAGDDADWRVAPPTLAVTQRGRCWLGIVIGARSVALLERLHATAKETANLQTLAFPAYPDQFLVASNAPGRLALVAGGAGLKLQDDAPAAVLASLPPVDDPCVRHRAELPFGSEWSIERFCSDNLAWRTSTLSDASAARGGLFRFHLRHQRYVLFCARGAAFRIPGQVGKYLVLKRHRRNVLRYDEQKRLLSVPASCRPPFLVERALILCSGLPPSIKGAPQEVSLYYTEIPERIAVIVAALLRQRL